MIFINRYFLNFIIINIFTKKKKKKKKNKKKKKKKKKFTNKQ